MDIFSNKNNNRDLVGSAIMKDFANATYPKTTVANPNNLYPRPARFEKVPAADVYASQQFKTQTGLIGAPVDFPAKGGYNPPSPVYKQITNPTPLPWAEKTYQILWVLVCLSFAGLVITAFTGIVCWGSLRHYYNMPDGTGVVIKSVIMPLYDTLYPIDDRIFTNSSIDEGVLYNNTQALQNIRDLPIRVLNYTTEWLDILGINSPYIDVLDPVSASGTINTFLASDVKDILPASAIWNSDPLPRLGVQYAQDSTLPNNFESLLTHQLLIELTAAVQQLAENQENMQAQIDALSP